MVSDYLTPAVCAAYCSSVEGATFFGVQAARKCFCGDTHGKYGVSSICADPCTGDGDQVCGGLNTNSVYTLLPLEGAETGELSDVSKEGVCSGDGGYCGCYVDAPRQALLKGGVTLDG